ncbi:hypothetical protein MKZ38_010293 [Zalerion maritima]|uniref:Uncharacterized protein n=1 Tax=Zalerion maritima TaxID=339359 RepID=A0AAD5RTL4_9PEZI|nr:hypothetical protein MKZ38_010293 [Zalerion maritima]
MVDLAILSQVWHKVLDPKTTYLPPNGRLPEGRINPHLKLVDIGRSTVVAFIEQGGENFVYWPGVEKSYPRAGWMLLNHPKGRIRDSARDYNQLYQGRRFRTCQWALVPMSRWTRARLADAASAPTEGAFTPSSCCWKDNINCRVPYITVTNPQGTSYIPIAPHSEEAPPPLCHKGKPKRQKVGFELPEEEEEQQKLEEVEKMEKRKAKKDKKRLRYKLRLEVCRAVRDLSWYWQDHFQEQLGRDGKKCRKAKNGFDRHQSRRTTAKSAAKRQRKAEGGKMTRAVSLERVQKRFSFVANDEEECQDYYPATCEYSET